MKKFSWTNIVLLIVTGYLAFKWASTRPAGVINLENHVYANIDGETVSSNSLENKVVFLNYWATWCGPCIKEMPSINALQEAYNDRDDIVFIVASNENKTIIEQFASKKELSLPLYKIVSTGDTAVKRIPLTYIIDKEGKVRKSATGARNWNSVGTKKLIDKMLAS